ncbi:MAG: flagellar hook-length control protein FliK [Tissierella sp.]|nr:flagellar hook-length control protein FliK [Tissierella sp.]
MEINSAQIVKIQNIPTGTTTKVAEGEDDFSMVLAQVAGMADGEEMDMASDLLNLVETATELIEEEEDQLLFNPMNIPWMLMNTSQNVDSEQIVDGGNPEMVESVDMDIPTMDQNLVANMETVEDAMEVQSSITETELEGNKDFSLELENEILLANDTEKPDIKKLNLGQVSMENLEKDSVNAEARLSESQSISIDKDIEVKEEVSFKDVNVKESKNSDLDLSQNQVHGFKLEKATTGEISQEPIAQRNIDFDESIQRVNDTIIELMDIKADGENSSMKVKLHPEELGVVDVTLKMEEGKLIARILVENEQVRELFNNHMNQLNDKLAKQEISISKVQVDLNFNSNNQSNSSNNSQNNRKNPFRTNHGMISSNGIGDPITSEGYTNPISGSNGLNILA